MTEARENRASLLWNCSTALKPETHTHKLLKSYYMNMCRRYVKNTIQIPKEKFATTQMCSHCGLFWSESEFRMKLKSQHVTVKGKTKRLIEKLGKSKEPGQKALLTGKQRKRAKWLQKRATQHIEIKCDQCQHKSIVKLDKPKNKRKPLANVEEATNQEEAVVIENEQKPKTKKKKKNKDKLAGLKVPLDNSKPKEEKQQNATNKQKTPQKQTATTTAKTCPTATTAQTPKITPQLAQSSKTKKKKKSSNASTTTTSPAANNSNNKVQKVVSKTQQQNSLLQLAALLKKNSSNSGKSSTQNRLESLLK
ncbi:uncharacterized protein [Musca autumnalis]|uniref:uncharacterized protein n=1 Tax=Musca autumnalis TaxID=221902 RepID=UPI003CF1E4A5